MVYYKRANNNDWKGPGTVIGQDGQQVLAKHVSTYIRVHPCKLQMVNHYTDSNDVMGPSKNISSNSQFKSSQSEKNLSSITETEDESNEVVDTEVLPESELPFESQELSENESQELNENDDNRKIIISDGNICDASNSSGDISDNRELNNIGDNISDNREYDISVIRH